MQFAYAAHIPEMVQAIFCALVINEAVELELSSRAVVDCMMSDLRELNWDIVEAWLEEVDKRLRDAQVPRLVEILTNPQPCAKVTSRLKGAPPVSSDENGDVPEGLAGPQVRQIAKTKSTSCMKSPDELLAEGTQGVRPRRGCQQALRPTKGRPLREGPVPELVAEGPEFPGAPTCSDPQDGPGSHFPNPKVIPTLKKTTLEKKYLLPTGYTFVIPKADATVDEPPAKCIAVYHAALNYGLRFPLHSVTEDILNKYEPALAQVVPTS
ncbi:hypothetical protein Cgig2_009031 [Carnegiea gigantea]|uniref:Uncharacterized protein n=1 Tax=Carnegiea gigantea TaxID=171969 RepID=A0A9Q1KE15_9CARY|nr:hypothetical protein Cgig2_009031 [Carnegiea gigantea]